jgi:hypothetical protein
MIFKDLKTKKCHQIIILNCASYLLFLFPAVCDLISGDFLDKFQCFLKIQKKKKVH